MQLGYFIIRTDNVPATVKLYKEAFQLECYFEDENGHYAKMATGTTMLTFINGELDPQRPARAEQKTIHDAAPVSMEIGLIVTDIKQAYQYAIAHGAVGVREPKLEIWGQTLAYVRDNNGVLIVMATPETTHPD